MNPLASMEVLGVTAPVRLRRLHQMKITGESRHNNNEGEACSPSSNQSADNNSQPIMESSPIMTNLNNAATIQDQEQAIPEGSTIEFTSVAADGQPLKELKMDMRVTHVVAHKTKLQTVVASAKQVGTIGGGVLIGMAAYEGAKLLVNWLVGDSDSTPVA